MKIVLTYSKAAKGVLTYKVTGAMTNGDTIVVDHALVPDDWPDHLKAQTIGQMVMRLSRQVGL